MTNQDNSLDQYLQPTSILNSDHPAIIVFTEKALNGTTAPEEQAEKLFYAVRDNIAYDPRVPFYLPEHYVASTILKNAKGYCVQKAGLLCAMGRAAKIPSRLGFADIRNHGATPEIIEMMGCNIFAYHGYTEFLINGKWIKATPAFDTAIFEKHNIAPVEFDGRNDAIFPSHDLNGNLYVEYLTYHGTSADLPLDDIMARWREIYGAERVKLWKGVFEKLS